MIAGASVPAEDSVGPLFLAIGLTEAAKAAMSSALRPLDLPGRVVRAEKWHLTLVYIGAATGESCRRVVAELARSPLGPAGRITFGALGAFPRAARASVLWLGLRDGAEYVSTLQARVRAAVTRAGLPTEARPFVPHLTVSRLRPAADVRALLESAPALEVPMPVDSVRLFRSPPRGGAAPYEELERFHLRNP